MQCNLFAIFLLPNMISKGAYSPSFNPTLMGPIERASREKGAECRYLDSLIGMSRKLFHELDYVVICKNILDSRRVMLDFPHFQAR